MKIPYADPALPVPIPGSVWMLNIALLADDYGMISWAQQCDTWEQMIRFYSVTDLVELGLVRAEQYTIVEEPW